MAGETPTRRGRPRKPKQDDDGDVVQRDKETPKRGRGRPPKAKTDGDDAKGSNVTPKRGRGRPPKAQLQISATTPKSTRTRKTSTKAAAKPRGRPRKSEAGTPKDTTKPASIVGGYAITCKDISEQWSVQGDDFGLDISESSTPGIFMGSFDFGILEGAMILSRDETLLESYIDKLESESEPPGDDEDSEGEDEQFVSSGRKRKATGAPGGHPAKQVKVPNPGLKFHILWRGRDTSEGEIHHVPSPGSIRFTNKKYTKFRGTVDLPAVGADVEIVGEKVTDQINAGNINSWNDYTEEGYERANARRWL